VKRNRFAVVAAAAALLLLSYSGSAHHSGVIYDRENPITLEGTVTGYEFVNPHVRIIFDAKDKDGSEGPSRLHLLEPAGQGSSATSPQKPIQWSICFIGPPGRS